MRFLIGVDNGTLKLRLRFAVPLLQEGRLPIGAKEGTLGQGGELESMIVSEVLRIGLGISLLNMVMLVVGWWWRGRPDGARYAGGLLLGLQRNNLVVFLEAISIQTLESLFGKLPDLCLPLAAQGTLVTLIHSSIIFNFILCVFFLIFRV